LHRLAHEWRLAAIAVAAGVPALVIALVLLLQTALDAELRWLLGAAATASLAIGALLIRSRAAFPLQTLANLLGSLREGDFSLRLRGGRRGGALGELILEANALAATLREERLGAREATAILRTVMAEIDVAIFAFDGGGRLRLVNRAGERLLGTPAERLLGDSAEELGLADFLRGAQVRTFERAFPGAAGRWEARRSGFRQGGLPHQMLVLSDLSRALREEERKAWQRLIRVLGHELNNSLAPITSIADSLRRRLEAGSLDGESMGDLKRGLGIVGERAEGLAHFLASYSQLAKLPEPRPEPLVVGEWVRGAAGLDNRLAVAVRAGPEVTLHADRAQLQQLLINLVRNAVDAALATHGGVEVGWRLDRQALEVWVADEGPGLANPANLFVPFFTTKPGGSGIGLALSRQIAEAHGGSLELINRSDRRGCRAVLRLPC